TPWLKRVPVSMRLMVMSASPHDGFLIGRQHSAAAGQFGSGDKSRNHRCAIAIDAETRKITLPSSTRVPYPAARSPDMNDAVIVSTARTPIGKAFRGAFNMTHGATMAGHVIAAAVERAKLDAAEVED